MRREILSWSDVDKLVDYLIPQIHGRFDSMVIITRGGIVPGGMLMKHSTSRTMWPLPSFSGGLYWLGGIHPEQRFAVPEFLQFPDDDLLVDRRVLVVDDVWTRGRNIVTVAGRIDAAGGMPETCVLHYKPALSLYPGHTPTYYAAVTDAFIVYPWEIDRDIEATSVWN
ncbi:MAG: phosphoribosyltransferase [Anaerolineae bacterium]|nr:phosphoribosyltransferase [Anaerolineae bacterium]